VSLLIADCITAAAAAAAAAADAALLCISGARAMSRGLMHRS